ncbi:ABC transporter permease [Saccharopolyspora montiporae]|uniref:ABC transporter permease n=1 Tax=Saccharopolyspora montiporae TaxID=2781240 RepID=UPI001D1375A2|nr:ABC transporter permease [Saccharopolyspora sp. HNM0983]
MSLSVAPDAPAAERPRAPGSEVRAGRRWRPRNLRRWISPVVILVVWQLASGTGVLPPDKLAAPDVILRSAWELALTGELGSHLGVSLSRVLAGLAIGVLIGIGAGLCAGLGRWGDDLLDPPLQMLRTLPHLGLVPLFILWFGIGEAPKIALVAMGVVFPLYLNVHGAIRGVDPKLLEASRVLGFTRTERIRHVVLPSALPGTLIGLRQGLGIAWLSLIISEQVNTENGIGYMINNAREFLRTDIIVVGLLIYAALGLITDALVRRLERRALRWRPETRTR